MCVHVCAYTNVQAPFYLNILNFNDTFTYTDMNNHFIPDLPFLLYGRSQTMQRLLRQDMLRVSSNLRYIY